MSTLSAKTIRIACNQSSDAFATDALTGAEPILFRGAAAKIQCALFSDDPSATTYITDVSNITSVELLIRVVNSSGTLLVDKVVLQAAIAPSTYAAWAAGTGQQFEFSLSDSDTSWDVKSDGQLHLYFSITVMTAANIFTVARGDMVLQDVGIVDVVAPEPPSGFISLTPAATASTNIAVVRGQVVVQVIAAAGLISYTYKLALLITDVIPGSLVDMSIEVAASDNPVIEVHNGTSLGTLLHAVSGDPDNIIYQHIVFRFNGTAWVKFGPEIS